MAKYVIEDTTLTGIADAIREKTETTEDIPVAEMRPKILGITSGGMTASIFVTGLSETDTVTASFGDKTKGAAWNSTESRFEIIDILDNGMWTVTATNGKQTKTQDVLVDGAFEYEIEMDYKLWLYREGDECEDVTGGWVQTTTGDFYGYNFTGTVQFNDDSIYVAATIASLPFVNTANKIDMTGYSKIKIEYENSTAGTTADGRIWRVSVRLFTSVGLASMQNYDTGYYIELPNGNGTVEIDVSSVSDPIFVAVTASAANNVSANIKRVLLE